MNESNEPLQQVQTGELLALMRDPAYKPLTYQELAEHFGCNADAAAYKLFLKQLNAAEEAGLIARSKQDRYGLPEQMNLFRGKLSVHPRGFAFLISETAGQADLYIAGEDLHGALHNDIVLVRVIKGIYPPQPASGSSASGKKALKGSKPSSAGQSAGERPEGTVVRVLERGMKQLVGRVSEYGKTLVVIPDDKRLGSEVWIPEELRMDATEGQKVVVELTKYPDSKQVLRSRAVLEGKIIEVLGDADAPGVDVLSIIRRFGLPEAFPDDVIKQAESVPETVPVSADELPGGEEAWKGRRDLRDLKIVTIDGEDAKDLDDAVHVLRLDNGNWELGVHIADVSYYVTEGSPLDQEAYRRGTSVYLTDRVIPMLPKRLSNGICSLNPQVERLTLSCVMEIDAQGDMVKYDIFPSVIKTVERMTYTNVRRILEPPQPPVQAETAADGTGSVEQPDGMASDDTERTGNDPSLEAALAYTELLNAREELLKRYESLIGDFERMRELALILRRKRMRRGAIDFDFEEAKIIVDGEGRPLDIKLRERSIAEKIIEEFMLAANETVAAHVHWLNMPFMYRIHEDPDSEKLLHFATFANNLGYTLRGGKGDRIHPRALQQLLKDIEGTKEQQIISTVLLRSMKQAKYSATNEGHFGLAAEFYTHFTSPIRRYPDLIVHRVLRALIAGSNTLEDGQQAAWQEAMPDIARQSSERERLAVEAERAVEAMKKAQYMEERIGETFRGVVSSVTGFGFFVELPNTIEGLVRLADMNDDYYHFVEEQLMLVGERSSTVIRIGQEVLIRVAKVNVEEGQIDFALLKLYDEDGGEARKFVRGGNTDDPDWLPAPDSGRKGRSSSSGSGAGRPRGGFGGQSSGGNSYGGSAKRSGRTGSRTPEPGSEEHAQEGAAPRYIDGDEQWSTGTRRRQHASGRSPHGNSQGSKSGHGRSSAASGKSSGQPAAKAGGKGKRKWVAPAAKRKKK